MKIQSFRYNDINNNSYRGDAQQLSYRPIQPKESSSGTYSGGEPSKVLLEEDQWSTIQTLLQAIIDNESLHLDKRQMLTTHLQVVQAEEKHYWIIRRSEEQAALEAYLRQVLGI